MKAEINKEKCLVIYPEDDYDVYLLSEWKNNIKIDWSNVRVLVEKEIKHPNIIEVLNWAEQ